MNNSAKNPNLNHRQQAILELARQEGEVLVENLAETFDITPQTIRRDLSELCQLRLLQRIHGGAIVPDAVENLGYEARKRQGADNKKSIGKCASTLIPNDSSLFINIGTTTEQVAENLISHLGLMVITNNLNVVNTLRRCEGIDVKMAGGTVRSEDGGIVGESTTEFIDQFKVDFAIIGASAIEDDGTILDFDEREVRVAKAIIRNSRTVILVADEMKFRRTAPIRIGNISMIDYFITDNEPHSKFLKVCNENGVVVNTIANCNNSESST